MNVLVLVSISLQLVNLLLVVSISLKLINLLLVVSISLELINLLVVVLEAIATFGGSSKDSEGHKLQGVQFRTLLPKG